MSRIISSNINGGASTFRGQSGASPIFMGTATFHGSCVQGITVSGTPMDVGNKTNPIHDHAVHLQATNTTGNVRVVNSTTVRIDIDPMLTGPLAEYSEWGASYEGFPVIPVWGNILSMTHASGSDFRLVRTKYGPYRTDGFSTWQATGKSYDQRIRIPEEYPYFQTFAQTTLSGRAPSWESIIPAFWLNNAIEPHVIIGGGDPLSRTIDFRVEMIAGNFLAFPNNDHPEIFDTFLQTSDAPTTVVLEMFISRPAIIPIEVLTDAQDDPEEALRIMLELST